MQFEDGVQTAHRQLQIVGGDQDANLDFGGGDDLDVDTFVGKRAEHARCNAGVRVHARSDQRNFDDLVVAAKLLKRSVCADLFQRDASVLQVGFGDGEGDVRFLLVLRRALHDHVDRDVVERELSKDLGSNTWGVVEPYKGDLGVLVGIGERGDGALFHRLVGSGDGSSRRFGEGRADQQRHSKSHCRRSRARFQHACTERRHFEHLFVVDGSNFARRCHDSWIGSVDAFDIGEDLAPLSFQRRCQQYGGGVGAPSAERCDALAVARRTLKARTNGDRFFLQGC